MEKNREISIRIINVFEELLNKYSLKIPSNDLIEHKDRANIYGTDYYELEDTIVAILDENV